MSNYAKLYWLTRLDSISIFFGFLIAFAIISAIVFLIMHSDSPLSFETDKLKVWPAKQKNYVNWIKKCLFAAVFFLLIEVFLPSKRDVILIVAGGKTIDFIQSDTSINKIPAQTTAIISDFLNKKIKELKTTEGK